MNQQLPFFTAEQRRILALAPPAQEIKSIDNNPYLQTEYVEHALDAIIGAGNWTKQTTLKDIRTERRSKPGRDGRAATEQLYVAVTLETTLTIYASDGSERTRTFIEVTTGDAEQPSYMAEGRAIDNAAKSASSDGLKRCAKHLGRIFGMDLKNKTRVIPRLQADRTDGSGAVIDADAPTAPAPAAADAAPTRRLPAPRAPALEPAPMMAPTPPAVETMEPKPAAAAAHNSRPAARDSDAAPVDIAWELTRTPRSIVEWQACGRTILARVGGAPHAQALIAFCRQHARLIASMPEIAEGPGIQPMPMRSFLVKAIDERLAALDARTTIDAIIAVARTNWPGREQHPAS